MPDLFVDRALPDDGHGSKKTTAPLRFFVNVESSSGLPQFCESHILANIIS